MRYAECIGSVSNAGLLGVQPLAAAVGDLIATSPARKAVLKMCVRLATPPGPASTMADNMDRRAGVGAVPESGELQMDSQRYIRDMDPPGCRYGIGDVQARED